MFKNYFILSFILKKNKLSLFSQKFKYTHTFLKSIDIHINHHFVSYNRYLRKGKLETIIRAEPLSNLQHCTIANNSSQMETNSISRYRGGWPLVRDGVLCDHLVGIGVCAHAHNSNLRRRHEKACSS